MHEQWPCTDTAEWSCLHSGNRALLCRLMKMNLTSKKRSSFVGDAWKESVLEPDSEQKDSFVFQFKTWIWSQTPRCQHERQHCSSHEGDADSEASTLVLPNNCWAALHWRVLASLKLHRSVSSIKVTEKMQTVRVHPFAWHEVCKMLITH